MESTAILYSVKGSPQKARLIIDQVRGHTVTEALALLTLNKKRIALVLKKVLWSAISNAEYLSEKKNSKLNIEQLFIKECHINKGITKYRRRVRPAPMGRAYREQRRLFTVKFVLSDNSQE
ncbi:MAG: large ribosomal subunit protein uL22 [Acidobacteriota bacterium]